MKRSYSSMVKVKLFNLQGEVVYETKTKAGEIIKIQQKDYQKEHIISKQLISKVKEIKC